MHEAKQHRQNVWLTLTYDDDHLPSKYYTGRIHPETHKRIYGGTLHKPHMQRFYRDVRKAIAKGEPQLIHDGILRYYYGGEYGDKYRRPHYHACLFGLDLRDKKFITTTKDNFDLYESETIARLWPHGEHRLAELTWETAAYTARYLMKKITGQLQKQHYTVTDHDTGEIIELKPEFNDMSRRPGIGYKHYERYKKGVYMEKRSGVRVRGRLTAPPRYYDKLLQREDPEKYDRVKRQRFMENLKRAANHTPERLQAEEIITTQKIKSLKRKLD